IEFITWDDRPEFQIERILSEGPSLLPFSDDEILKSWFTTLIFCREKEKAFSMAREIEDRSYHALALSSIAEAVMEVGMMAEVREAATEALAAARKIGDAYDRVQALSSIAEALVKVGMMTEVREAAMEALAIIRVIEDAHYRVW